MKRVLIERNRYFDSVFLMRISHALEQLPDVGRAIVAMGTRANLDSLKAVGFALDESASPIHPSDLVIAIEAESDDAIDAAEGRARALLAGEAFGEVDGRAGGERPATIAEAIALDADLNLALISVPGAYAAREARQALRHGLHVMLFSDNVSVEDEIALKEEAIRRGLMMMGPDCGTAILGGAPLGFANAVRRGRIGIVGASGTGIQEISSLVHRLDGGISQAIGTGGRDLSGPVAARMTRFGIAALASDPETDVLVVVSKAPEPVVAGRVLDALRGAEKPAVVRFVTEGARAPEGSIRFAESLAEAAELACAAAGLSTPASGDRAGGSLPVEALPKGVTASGRIRGLFCGGTLAQEAWDLLRGAGIGAHSNVATDPAMRIEPGEKEEGHVLWDLGDDAFTAGVPHPMIAPSLRDDEVVRCANDPTVGIVLVDCVLGYGAHADPAGSLADAAHRALVTARADGRDLTIVASVTGTDADPQNRGRQVEALIGAGVVVAPSNAVAARWAAAALRGGAT